MRPHSSFSAMPVCTPGGPRPPTSVRPLPHASALPTFYHISASAMRVGNRSRGGSRLTPGSETGIGSCPQRPPDSFHLCAQLQGAILPLMPTSEASGSCHNVTGSRGPAVSSESITGASHNRSSSDDLSKPLRKPQEVSR